MVYQHKFRKKVKNWARTGGRTKSVSYVKASTGALMAVGAKQLLKKKYKKTKLTQRAKAEIGTHGGTYSNYYYQSRKAPIIYLKLSKTLSKNYYTINGASRITSSVGQQQANTLNTIFGYNDVYAISQKIAINQTNKFLLQSCSSELIMTNQDAGNVNVTIYDILARRDLSTSANIAFPDVAWARSYGDEGAVDANWNIPGATPFSADLFTQYFKVVKITHITMGQGQCHTHRIKFSPNKQIDGEYIKYNTNGFKGLTCHQMVVQHGLPYNDVTTKTQVSLGSTAIDYVFKKQYQFTWINDQDTTYSTTQSLPTSFTVNEDIMNEATGTATVDTVA